MRNLKTIIIVVQSVAIITLYFYASIQKTEADRFRMIAEQEAKQAIEEKQKAEEQYKLALEQRKIAKEKSKIAERYKVEAMAQTKIALELQDKLKKCK